MGNEIRSVLDAIAGSWIPKAALIAFVALLAITLAIVITQNAYTWLDATPPKGIASIDVGRLGMVVGTGGTGGGLSDNAVRSRPELPARTGAYTKPHHGIARGTGCR